jgi:hypothetical protein
MIGAMNAPPRIDQVFQFAPAVDSILFPLSPENILSQPPTLEP